MLTKLIVLIHLHCIDILVVRVVSGAAVSVVRVVFPVAGRPTNTIKR